MSYGLEVLGEGRATSGQSTSDSWFTVFRILKARLNIRRQKTLYDNFNITIVYAYLLKR